MDTLGDQIKKYINEEMSGNFVRAVEPYLRGHPLVLNGDLYIYENEGGFAPMSIEIGVDQIDVGVAIAKWAHAFDEGRPYSVKNEYARLINVKITVEVA